jgi:hypothetical protein
MGSAISSTYRILSLQTCLCSSQVEIGWLGRVDPSTDHGERKECMTKICLLMQENEAKKSVQVLMIKKRKVNLRSYTGSEI